MATQIVAARRIQAVVRRRIEEAYLLEQCRAPLPKLARALRFAPFRLEAGVWRTRYVYLTRSALCYQKLARRPSTSRVVEPESTQQIRFAEIVHVLGQLDQRLLIVEQLRRQVGGGSSASASGSGRGVEHEVARHTFSMPNAGETERWASALLRLCTLAGCPCPGNLEMGKWRLQTEEELAEAEALAAAEAARRTAAANAPPSPPPRRSLQGQRSSPSSDGRRLSRSGSQKRLVQRPWSFPAEEEEGEEDMDNDDLEDDGVQAVEAPAMLPPTVLASPTRPSVSNSPANLARARASNAAVNARYI